MSKLEMQQCVLGQVFTNCYFLKNKKTGELLIVDPGDYAEKVFQKVALMQGKPVWMTGRFLKLPDFPSRCSIHRDTPREAAATILRMRAYFSAEIHCSVALLEEPIFRAEVLRRS